MDKDIVSESEASGFSDLVKDDSAILTLKRILLGRIRVALEEVLKQEL